MSSALGMARGILKAWFSTWHICLLLIHRSADSGQTLHGASGSVLKGPANTSAGFLIRRDKQKFVCFALSVFAEGRWHDQTSPTARHIRPSETLAENRETQLDGHRHVNGGDPLRLAKTRSLPTLMVAEEVKRGHLWRIFWSSLRSVPRRNRCHVFITKKRNAQ